MCFVKQSWLYNPYFRYGIFMSFGIQNCSVKPMIIWPEDDWLFMLTIFWFTLNLLIELIWCRVCALVQFYCIFFTQAKALHTSQFLTAVKNVDCWNLYTTVSTAVWSVDKCRVVPEQMFSMSSSSHALFKARCVLFAWGLAIYFISFCVLFVMFLHWDICIYSVSS